MRSMRGIAPVGLVDGVRNEDEVGTVDDEGCSPFDDIVDHGGELRLITTGFFNLQAKTCWSCAELAHDQVKRTKISRKLLSEAAARQRQHSEQLRTEGGGAEL